MAKAFPTAKLTGSRRAKWLLESWPEMQARFIKVFPHEYKRVLGIPRVQQGFEPVRALAASATANTQPAGD